MPHPSDSTRRASRALTLAAPLLCVGLFTACASRPAEVKAEPRQTLVGMFTYFADAPRMVLCADGRSLPVQMAGDYLALERAYLAARTGPGAPLLARVEGVIAMRPSAEESQPPQPTLVVERFDRVLPGATCDQPRPDRPPDLPLVGRDWRLVWMGGQAFVPPNPGRAPQLRFEAGRVAGSDGCNRIAGSYTLDGAQLRFGPLAGTRMACAVGMAEADAFGAALQQVHSHALRGDLLELRAADGSLLLRLQAD